MDGGIVSFFFPCPVSPSVIFLCSRCCRSLKSSSSFSFWILKSAQCGTQRRGGSSSNALPPLSFFFARSAFVGFRYRFMYNQQPQQTPLRKKKKIKKKKSKSKKTVAARRSQLSCTCSRKRATTKRWHVEEHRYLETEMQGSGTGSARSHWYTQARMWRPKRQGQRTCLHTRLH